MNRSRCRPTPIAIAGGVGALLAVLVTLTGAPAGSAAHLEVDGGVLQTFAVRSGEDHNVAQHIDDSDDEHHPEPTTGNPAK